MKTATIFVSGNIQKVGYRTRIQGIAQYLQVDGCIKNLPDGRVKIVVQSTPQKVEEFVNKINVKDELITVDNVEVNYSNTFEKFHGFNKIVGPNETDSRLDKAINELKNITTAIKQGNQKLNTNIQELGNRMDQNHSELLTEIRGLRDDNNERVMDEVKEVANEIHEVKALVNALLKQS